MKLRSKPSLLSQLVTLVSSAFRVITSQQKFPNFSFDGWVDTLLHNKMKDHITDE
jgi:hypothetical protein